MDLYLSEEQEMIRTMVREFAQKEIPPWLEAMEKEERFPREIVKKMAENGLMGMPIPEKYGGSGADFLSYIIAIEELSKVNATIGLILSVHTSVGTLPILYFGNNEQKERFVPKLASGEWLGAFAVTETGAGSDPGRMKTRAYREGEHYRLEGSKIFITNGGEADTYVTFAVTDPNSERERISAFIVEKDTPHLMIGKREKKMGHHGSATTELIFDGAMVPIANRLGNEGEGFKIALSILNGGRIGIAAQALGIAEGALQLAVQYAKERKQFGKAIIEHQGIGFKCADMATRVEAARLLVYRAADLMTEGKRCRKEVSMAKKFASDTAMYVTTEGIQIFGGYGYSREYPIERYFRDAKVTQIYEGTNEIQALVIAKELLNF